MAEIVPFPEPAAPEPFRKVGLGYVYETAGVRMIVEYLKKRSDGLHGSLAVEYLGGGHIHEADHNFSSLSARSSLAKHLTARSESTPWGELLETFCVSVVRRERQGTPLLDMSEFAETPRAPDAIERLVPWRSYTWLFGEGGSCKGLIATAMAVCFATGKPFVGFTARQGNVAYLDWEDDREEMGHRLRSVCRGMGIGVPKGSFYWRSCRAGGTLKSQISQIAKEFSEREISYYIVDSVGLAAGSGSEHLPSEASALELFEALACLEATGVCIDHVAKSGIRDKSGPGQIYGSIYKTNLCRYSWEVKKQQDEGSSEAHVALFHNKTNRSKKWPPVGIGLCFEDDGRIVRLDREDVRDIPVLAEGTSIRQRMIRALEVARGPLHQEDLASNLGVDLVRVTSELGPSRSKGTFVRVSEDRKMIGLASKW
jgi:hypothetical protein